jgi:TRAP-type mannitol/chloroaromatic compound transport system permease small subunit
MSVPLHPINRWLQSICAGLTVLAVTLTFALVVARYVFGVGSIAAQDLVMAAHAGAFMLGASYALRRDQHVRVDIFYRAATPQTQALINLIGIVALLLPTMAVVGWMSVDYVADSWRIREGAKDSGGLPGVYLVKSLIPLMALLVSAQALALVPELWRQLRMPR